MLTADEWKEKQLEAKYPTHAARRTGKSFRTLLLAAHMASIGERVSVYSHTLAAARYNGHRFRDMFLNGEGVFQQTTPGLFRCRHSGGFVVFYSMGGTYDDYVRAERGNNTIPLFDI